MSDWAIPSGPAILVVAEPHAFAAMRDAAELIGATATRIDWAHAVAAIDDQAGDPVIAIEAEGTPAALLAEHLPAIASTAAAREIAVVASLAVENIDIVAAPLLGPGTQLLCTPDPLERVVALLAALRIGDIAPTVRESDRDRLRRLHDEVGRIAEALARLASRSVPSGEAVDDRRTSYDSGPGVDAADPQAIRQAIRARRLRDGFFPAGLFEDPAWDMLLDLFAAELEGTRVSVSSLCIAAAVAPTTALRWIAKMTEAGLLQRLPDPQDRRRAFMALTDRARAGMRGYLGALSRTGLAIA